MIEKVAYRISQIPDGVTVCDSNGDKLIAGTQTQLDNIYIVVDESIFLQENIGPTPPPPPPTPDFVEIGGLKWATKNIGATAVTDTGLYFAWGETQGYTAAQVRRGQKSFGWGDYEWNDGGENPSADNMFKYNSTDEKTVLELFDDAVQPYLGDEWRMPTAEEYEALRNAVTTAWTDNYQGSGVAGMVFTDRTDSSKVLFFPACGSCDNGGVYDVGSNGYYWSSSLYSGDALEGLLIDFNSDEVSWGSDGSRCYGFTVRGVLKEREYVEIAGIKWATMNIGATAITDTGLYFQWGDFQGYNTAQVRKEEKFFGWADYKYNSGGTDDPSASDIFKYNSIDGKTVLDLSDDAARANWGGQWRMPTTEEYVALSNAVNTAWTDNYQGSGVSGLVCTDKTDSSKELFFPAGGRCYDGEIDNVDLGYYWSGSLASGNIWNAHYLFFYNGDVNWQYGSFRCRGFAVRGVLS